MITTSPTEFLEAFATLAPLPDAPATARAAFLIAPSEFTLAEESARDNRYMDMNLTVDPLKALTQHSALAQALRADIPVITFPGNPATPDAVFPNNVFATARDRLIIGRMRHAVCQQEAERHDIRNFFGNVLDYDEIDLSDDRVWMNASAAASLSSGQYDALTGYGFAVGVVELSEIEKAGGSLRCCVGEIY